MLNIEIEKKTNKLKNKLLIQKIRKSLNERKTTNLKHSNVQDELSESDFK